jgi:hypothetical protein
MEDYHITTGRFHGSRYLEVGILCLPSVGSLEKKLKGFADKRTDLYQELSHDLTVQSQYLDEHVPR